MSVLVVKRCGGAQARVRSEAETWRSTEEKEIDFNCGKKVPKSRVWVCAGAEG